MTKFKNNKIYNILNEEHSGAEAIEGMILTPLMFATFVILLYFFFMILTYIAYGNIANSIAMELNMRQSGYSEAIENYKYAPKILTYRNSTTNNITVEGDIPSSAYLSSSNIIINPNTEALRCGTNFALTKYKNNFVMPFSQLTKITVTSSKSLNTSMKKKMAGTVIKVEIEYAPLTIGDIGRQLIKCKTVGYNVIS